MRNNTFNPEIEIINYFDELINQVEIDINEALENYNDEQVLSDLDCFDTKKRELLFYNILNYFYIENNDDKDQTVDTTVNSVDLWSESTKVVDYLSQVRMRTIEELKKAQEESLENYKLNSTRFNSLEKVSNESKIEELKSQLFGGEFYFQVRLTSKDYNSWIFNVFTFVTDFYMSPSDINRLEVFINYNRLSDLSMSDYKLVFDEKMVLISLLARYFYDNIITVKYPNHVICVSKRDTLNFKDMNVPSSLKVKLICSSVDLSNLESLTIFNIRDPIDIELDGLSSLKFLHLNINSVERFAAKKLTSLKCLYLDTNTLDNRMLMQISEHLSVIKGLRIRGVFSDINLDHLVNLEFLRLSGEIGDGFNFGLFDSLCDHLQILTINITNIDEESMSKLFYGHNFPHVYNFWITNSKIAKLEKKLFDGFPMLLSAVIYKNKELRLIENEAFSSLTNLIKLDLSKNCIETINQCQFLGLVNLDSLNLKRNRIQCIEENCFSDLENLEELNLSSNLLSTLHHKSLNGLRNLKYLDIRNNKLRTLHLRKYFPNTDIIS